MTGYVYSPIFGYLYRPIFGTPSIPIVTCDHMGDIFTAEKTWITEPHLPHVKPIFPDTTNDKCIETVKWKFLEGFSKEEENIFNKCIQKNAHPEELFRHNIKNFDYSITSANFSFLKGKSDVVVVEIGGYTGQLLQKLVPITGAKTYVVLEPVPSFHDKLVKNIDALNLNSVVKTYNFGVGKTYKEMSVDIQGDGTSIFKVLTSQQTESISIVNVVDFFVQIGAGCNTVDLLTINCEGCEFDVLETLLSTTLIEKFDNIQFQPHYAATTGNYTCRYCRLRQFLARTHMIKYEYPHIWESWKRTKK
jgi:FkbM family methyltransferase